MLCLMETSLKVANFMESPHGRLCSSCSLPPHRLLFSTNTRTLAAKQKAREGTLARRIVHVVHLSEVLPGEQQAEVLANHS